jgi:hypothetical protein
MPARALRPILLALTLLGAVTSGWPAAAQELHHAALIVRHGDGSLTYAYVPFSEASLSGIELLRRSGLPLATVSFGGLGEGVCSIEERGCVPSECRKRVCQGSAPDDPFWQYFQLTDDGTWVAFALGASSARVQDGDIVGWSWTGTTPQLPVASFEDFARRAGASGLDATELALVRSPELGTESSTPGWVYVAALALLAGTGLVAAGLLRTKRMAQA